MLFKGLVLLAGCTLSSSVGYSLGVYLIVNEVNKDKELNLDRKSKFKITKRIMFDKEFMREFFLVPTNESKAYLIVEERVISWVIDHLKK